jgi:hypothetical protein
MLRKLIIFAITSGLAAKAYRSYTAKRDSAGTPPATGKTPSRAV